MSLIRGDILSPIRLNFSGYIELKKWAEEKNSRSQEAIERILLKMLKEFKKIWQYLNQLNSFYIFVFIFAF